MNINPNVYLPSVGLNNGFNKKGPNIDIIEYNSPEIFLEYIYKANKFCRNPYLKLILLIFSLVSAPIPKTVLHPSGVHHASFIIHEFNKKNRSRKDIFY